MFTGIIEEIGTIERVNKGTNSAQLFINASKVLENTKLGDSIAVNGVCLTVTSISGNKFSADVMHETLNRSSLAKISAGSKVNLERAMSAEGRFGGHIVSGHVDGLGKIIDVEKDDNAIWFWIETDSKVMDYIVEKGSITIDGISLTVARLKANSFAISAIPHTVKETILCYKGKGDTVNLETDIIGKYVEKFLLRDKKEEKTESKITKDFLERYGF